MNLNEAIRHCEEVALQCSDENKACALEHVQLMQWLKELRVLRQLVKPEYLTEIKNLQSAWGKDWEEYFNRELCRDVTGPFRRARYKKARHAALNSSIDKLWIVGHAIFAKDADPEKVGAFILSLSEFGYETKDLLSEYKKTGRITI